jgi:glycogen debranching enzyme
VNATAPQPSPTADDLDAADRPLRLYALKHVDTFVVADAHGDIHGRDDGVFRDDTRVLSRWILRVGGTQPSLLTSDVSRDNVHFTAHLTNRALPELGDRSTPRGIVHVARTRFVFDGRVHERVDLHNFGGRPVRVPVASTSPPIFRTSSRCAGCAVRAAVATCRRKSRPTACRCAMRVSTT